MTNDNIHPLQKSFGLRIKEFRDLKGMTQEDLAEGAALFRTYLSRIEMGHANPTLTVIHALAKGLNVAPGLLLEEPEILSIPKRKRATSSISRGRVDKN
ncbi:helix-turn-helix domain-containing protein [Limnohabitans sp. B9-3]|uniref:helix-turn-helix domain-containing protein n=1 Tax=Limnohabitans sp. B9-3 TaxID=1100707 RepID=UPI00117B8A01|nr:helix-turn-helix transcriptional regulator [Limnohabitans sp. B9-3]